MLLYVIKFMECQICFVTFGTSDFEKHSIECMDNQLKIMKNFKPKIENTELKLTSVQQSVMDISIKKSKHYSKNVKELLKSKIISMGYGKKDIHLVEKYFKQTKTIVHFGAEKIMGLLCNDTHFRNLFEVHATGGSSNHSIRTEWENNMFRSMYKEVEPFDKVKYGTINIFSSNYGVRSAQGYGTSYLILKDHNQERITYVHGDSSHKEMHIGSYKGFYHIIYYLRDNTLKALLEKIINNVEPTNPISFPYIEAQIHGELQLNRDIEKVVIPDNLSNKLDIIDNVRRFCDKNNCSWSFVSALT